MPKILRFPLLLSPVGRMLSPPDTLFFAQQDLARTFIFQGNFNILASEPSIFWHRNCKKPPPANATQGYPNVAQLTMTAMFYRQDALTRPNLTLRRPNLAQIRVTLH